MKGHTSSLDYISYAVGSGRLNATRQCREQRQGFAQPFPKNHRDLEGSKNEMETTILTSCIIFTSITVITIITVIIDITIIRTLQIFGPGQMGPILMKVKATNPAKLPGNVRHPNTNSEPTYVLESRPTNNPLFSLSVRYQGPYNPFKDARRVLVVNPKP